MGWEGKEGGMGRKSKGRGSEEEQTTTRTIHHSTFEHP